MKKIIALALVLVFAFSFAACKKEEEAPVETTTDAIADVTLDETPSEEATEAVTKVDADGNVITEPATEAPKAPEGKDAIVEYYNTVINKVKPSSKSIHSNYMKHAVAGKITGIPKALDSVGQSLIKDNMGEDDSKKNVTWSSKKDKEAFFPVEGETYASKLTAADVKSATIEEKGGKWVITITTVADPRAEGYSHSKGHATKAFNAVLPGIIDGYIPGIAKSLFSVGTVATAYPSSTVKVTVDPATGNVTHANYKLYWTLYIPLSGKDVVLPFSTENDYTINW